MNSAVRILAKPSVFTASLLIYLIFAALILPQHNRQAALYTPDGAYLDTLYAYPAKAVYPVLESFGSEGRRAYIRARFSFDLAYPLAYTFCLAASISFFLVRIRHLSIRVNFRPGILLFLPLLALGFDYLENFSLVFLMTLFPDRFIPLEYLASVSTRLKWLFAALSLVTLVSAIILWIISGIRYRNQRQG